jgi:hypothetical protein
MAANKAQKRSSVCLRQAEVCCFLGQQPVMTCECFSLSELDSPAAAIEVKVYVNSSQLQTGVKHAFIQLVEKRPNHAREIAKRPSPQSLTSCGVIVTRGEGHAQRNGDV